MKLANDLSSHQGNYLTFFTDINALGPCHMYSIKKKGYNKFSPHQIINMEIILDCIRKESCVCLRFILTETIESDGLPVGRTLETYGAAPVSAGTAGL